jgi:hypothetical protein
MYLVIPDTKVVGIGRIVVQGQPGPKKQRNLARSTSTNKLAIPAMQEA